MAAGDITVESQDVWGTKNVTIGTIEGPASAVDGGVALNPALFGLSDVDFVKLEPVEIDEDEIVLARYDYATDKVQFYEGDGAASGGDSLQEISATDDLHLLTIRFLAIGRE